MTMEHRIYTIIHHAAVMKFEFLTIDACQAREDLLEPSLPSCSEAWREIE